MRDDYWTLSFPRLNQDTSDDFYPDTKDDTVTTDQPAWATDPRGLPPALKDRDGYVWPLHDDGVHYEGSTIDDIEAHHGPLIPLWPDTPPTSPLPDLSRWHPVPVGARIPEGTEWARKFSDGTHMTNIAMFAFTAEDNDHPRYTEHLIPAPDPDAHWIRAIAEATPETAPTVYAAIKGEQA